MGAYRFISNNSRFSVAHGADLSFEPITVAAWVYRLGEGGTDARIVNKGLTNNAATFNFTENPSRALRMRAVVGASTQRTHVSSTEFLVNDTWMPVFGTFVNSGGTHVRGAYKVVGGVRSGTTSSTNSTLTTVFNTATLTIGAQEDGVAGFNGYIYAVALWDRILTLDEMVDYSAGIMPAGVRFLWMLDDPTGPQENTGLITGYSAAPNVTNPPSWDSAFTVPVTYGEEAPELAPQPSASVSVADAPSMTGGTIPESTITTLFDDTSIPSGWSIYNPVPHGGVVFDGKHARIAPGSILSESISNTSNQDTSVGIEHAITTEDVDIAVRVDGTDTGDFGDVLRHSLNLLVIGDDTSSMARFSLYQQGVDTERIYAYGYTRAGGSGSSPFNGAMTAYFGGIPNWVRLRYTAVTGLWEFLHSGDGVLWRKNREYDENTGSLMHTTRSFTPRRFIIGVHNSIADGPTVPIRIGRVVDMLVAPSEDLRGLVGERTPRLISVIDGAAGALPADWVDQSLGEDFSIAWTGTALRLRAIAASETPNASGRRAAVRYTGELSADWRLYMQATSPQSNSNFYFTPGMSADPIGTNGVTVDGAIDQYVWGGAYGLEVQVGAIRRPIRVDDDTDKSHNPVTPFSTGLDETPYCHLRNTTFTALQFGGIHHIVLEQIDGRYRIMEWLGTLGDQPDPEDPDSWNHFNGEDFVNEMLMRPYLSLSYNNSGGNCQVDLLRVEYSALESAIVEVDLEPEPSASASIADEAALTQQHALVAETSVTTATSDSAALTQQHALVAEISVTTATSDSATLQQGHALAPEDCAGVILADAATLAQHHQLTPEASASTSTAERATLAQVGTLDPEASTSASAADAASLTQHHQLTPEVSMTALVAASATLSAGTTLQPEDSAVLAVSDEAALTQHHSLTPTASVVVGVGGEPQIAVAGTLSAETSVALAVADETSLTQRHLLTPEASVVITISERTVLPGEFYELPNDARLTTKPGPRATLTTRTVTAAKLTTREVSPATLTTKPARRATLTTKEKKWPITS